MVIHHLLYFQAGKVEVKEVDFNSDFITRMMPKIDWIALQKAAKEVRGHSE